MLVSSTICRAPRLLQASLFLRPPHASHTSPHSHPLFFPCSGDSQRPQSHAAAAARLSRSLSAHPLYSSVARPPPRFSPQLFIMSANESLPLFHENNGTQGQDNMVPNTSMSHLSIAPCPSPTHHQPRLLRPAWLLRLAALCRRRDSYPDPASVAAPTTCACTADSSPGNAQIECISDDALIHLKSYKYSSVDKSPVSKYILGPWVRHASPPYTTAPLFNPPIPEPPLAANPLPCRMAIAQTSPNRYTASNRNQTLTSSVSSGTFSSTSCRYGWPPTW